MIADTFAWLAYFDEEPAYAFLERAEAKTPTLVLAELQRKLVQRGVPVSEQQRLLAFVKKKSVLLNLDETRALRGGVLAESEALPLLDALIYAYASEEDLLLTGDPHFRGKKFVQFVDTK